ncbi:MAG: hypothetical protein H0V36_06890 [Chloroflexi bacterium]|nr:hypothetical protein [Chloroflexota bacterium]
MRLFSAELLKLRRRWASYIVLIILLGLMSLVYLLIGVSGRGSGGGATFISFPGSFGIINQFVFGLGSLLGVAYAAAIAGADWNWSVFRVAIARGESRSRYVLMKALAIAFVLLIGVIIAYAVGLLLTYVAAGLAGVQPGSLLTRNRLDDVARSLYLGFPVLIERAAIGFAVAVLLRSQLAGVIVGIVLYIGESILAAVLIGITLADQGFDGIGRLGMQWYQFLPFSIGDSVLSATTGLGGDDITSFILSPIPLNTALIVTAIYLAAALGVAVVAVERSEISG